MASLSALQVHSVGGSRDNLAQCTGRRISVYALVAVQYRPLFVSCSCTMISDEIIDTASSQGTNSDVNRILFVSKSATP